MTYYETMYIVHPAIESGRLKDLILSVEKNMHNLGGETCAISVWGKKKLAYPINKERYGMYVLFQFKSDGSSNKDFNLGLDHNANILAYLTTKIEEDGLLNDIASLDNQLGLSQSSETTKLEEKPEEEPEEDTSTEEKPEEEPEEDTSTEEKSEGKSEEKSEQEDK